MARVKTSASKMVEAYTSYYDRRNQKMIKEQEEAEYKEYLDRKESERIMSLGSDVNNSKDEYYKFKQLIKKSLLDTAINKIFISSIPIEKEILFPENIIFAQAYTLENGVQKTINEFKRSTPLLSSIALLIENTEREIMSKVVQGDESTYTVDPEDIINFDKALEDESISDMSDIIRNRVQITIDDFIDNNRKDKAKHIEILDKSKEKIGKTDNEDIIEDIMNETTRKLNSIQRSRSFSIFEGMVRRISESAYSDNELKDIMVSESGGLDMESIMETAIVMYTFLETLNTAKMRKVNESYLKDIYLNL